MRIRKPKSSSDSSKRAADFDAADLRRAGAGARFNKATIALDPPKLTPEDVAKLQAAQRAAQDAN